jgi:hypothetical protein
VMLDNTPLTLPSPPAAPFQQAGHVVLPAGGEGAFGSVHSWRCSGYGPAGPGTQSMPRTR